MVIKARKNDTKFNYFKQLTKFTFYEIINFDLLKRFTRNPPCPPLQRGVRGISAMGILIDMALI
jgi:hypothetical protein